MQVKELLYEKLRDVDIVSILETDGNAHGISTRQWKITFRDNTQKIWNLIWEFSKKNIASAESIADLLSSTVRSELKHITDYGEPR